MDLMDFVTHIRESDAGEHIDYVTDPEVIPGTHEHAEYRYFDGYQMTEDMIEFIPSGT